jgi:hypothetical protein
MMPDRPSPPRSYSPSNADFLFFKVDRQQPPVQNPRSDGHRCADSSRL